MYNVKESQFVHQMPFLFSSGPSLHPFPLCCLHRATELSGSRVVSSSFHLHLANAETQKDEKEEEREVIFPLLPSAGFPQAGRVPLPQITLMLSWLFPQHSPS